MDMCSEIVFRTVSYVTNVLYCYINISLLTFFKTVVLNQGSDAYKGVLGRLTRGLQDDYNYFN